MIVMDGLAGIILILLGISSLKDISKNLEKSMPHDANFFLTAAKTFTLTILNPFVVLFFMTLSVQILPIGVTKLPLSDVIQASFMIGAGSLTILTCLSLIASIIGNTIKRKYLVLVEYLTGFIFIGAGIYFFIHLFKSLFYS
jgi:threonine/homoserine/homoserine lactone efflux protein